MKIIEILKPFYDALNKDITLDNAIEQASYNAMMSYIKDIMMSYATSSKVGAIFFGGPIGFAATFFISLLIKYAASKGRGFAVITAYSWHSKELLAVYIESMDIINSKVKGKVLTDEEIKYYRQRISEELKKFYHIGKFVSAK